ncbi:hypothetical protein FQA47_023212 [Oryzias melastigma]|uniref:Uncharacterized protein n=1 Tax=Oryzias melastigma TaxID=30732 RepID=A0A834FGP7_ORYME|nr:hypothetical protein FQA47_023212 [Oryzias melastigma]
MSKQSSNLIQADRTAHAGGKWNSVMASLGIKPGQDMPLTGKNRESPPSDYPYRLQSPPQGGAWDSPPPKNSLSPAAAEGGSICKLCVCNSLGLAPVTSEDKHHVSTGKPRLMMMQIVCTGVMEFRPI